MNSFQPLIERKIAEQKDLEFEAFARFVRNRASFFLKHGERFDRRLYAEVCALNAIYLNFIDFRLINSNPEGYRQINRIKTEMLEAGQLVYKDFP